jgi:hypothetical protein
VVTTRVRARLVGSNVVTGLIASLCCGGSLVFASIGLGSFFSALGLSRYVPQAMAAGALSIAAINYFVYRRLATCGECTNEGELLKLQRGMFWSATFGVAVMVVSFVVLEWLNHAVVHPQRFLTHARYGAALIPGVANSSLLYALASFAVLALLWALPFPRLTLKGVGPGGPIPRMLRAGVIFAALALFIFLIVDAIPRGGSAGPGNGQHGTSHGPHH